MKSNGLHSSPANHQPCPPHPEGDTEGTGLSTRRSGCSLLWLREAVVGQGRGRPGVGRAVMPNLCCQLPPALLAVAVPWWHSVAVIPSSPHCRACSAQDDTSSELQRGASPDGGEQRADHAFQGQGALARYPCVPLAWGEPELFVPGLDTGAFRGVRIPFCCMEFTGCRDERL